MRAFVVGLAGTLAAGGLLTLAADAQAAPCVHDGRNVTCTFTNAAAPETFVVPAGVTAAQIRVQGGSGGHGASPPLNGPADGGVGGGGGTVTAAVTLTPGTVLRMYVGGNGADGQPSPASCETGDPGGAGGTSGGLTTGGKGGNGFTPGGDMGCAAGGGGGASFVLANGQTIEQVNLGDAVPFLVAGGGGGGGGGSGIIGGAGGTGGGNASSATAGGRAVPPQVNDGGGAPGAAESIAGESGVDADGPTPNADDAGGGGGGGYLGGAGGGLSSGGGGGAGLSPGNAVVGTAASGAPGSVTITYSVTDTENCDPDVKQCVVTPPAGEETTFKITAAGGSDNATLFGILNGGLPPTCKSAPQTLSPDWVQFGFENAKDGRTWSKRIVVTGTEPTTKSTARRVLAETQICFAAPYKFVTKRGEKLTKVGGNWEGLLAHCQSRIVAEAKRDHPKLARPCIEKRTLVSKDDGWVVRVHYFVPNGELDPKGRSVRKKGKKKH